ncbi:LysM repeat protein [Caldalkalibacillus uzonensis]|uniref:Peptidoglycan hydrolase n=1 Tax=Caldalkalibacillus uzonensis TaxID=353224 RepID=A0ABU0CV78_9BACI|nr:glucosaminidase domain-containing protein [Caldalkalibacillus uzonensis]MDQ0340280.1 LysM repeat protein [Caldalkalibacillus uzonensis]
MPYRKEFISKIANLAVENRNKTGVLASIVIAQAILESNWGRSQLTVQANNLFGIKGSYNGQYVTMPTREWSKEKGWHTVNARFRKYPSWKESIEDHTRLFVNGVSWNRNLYKPVLEAKNYREAAQALQGTYATDPQYAQKLINLIESYKLHQYDNEKQPKSETRPKPQPQTQQTSGQAPSYHGFYYTIRRGDTLSQLAQRFAVPMSFLQGFNDIKNPNLIIAGRQLYVPKSYTIKPGDTLSQLARRSPKNYRELARINGISNPDRIIAGHSIYL